MYPDFESWDNFLSITSNLDNWKRLKPLKQASTILDNQLTRFHSCDDRALPEKKIVSTVSPSLFPPCLTNSAQYLSFKAFCQPVTNALNPVNLTM